MDSRTANTVKARPISLDPISLERQDLVIILRFVAFKVKLLLPGYGGDGPVKGVEDVDEVDDPDAGVECLEEDSCGGEAESEDNDCSVSQSQDFSEERDEEELIRNVLSREGCTLRWTGSWIELASTLQHYCTLFCMDLE